MNRQDLFFLTIVVSVLLLGFSSTAYSGEITLARSGFVTRVKSIKELRESRVVLQNYDFSCGSAALATLLTYSYDNPKTEQSVFKSMFAVGDQPHIRKVGFSLLDMQKYLKGQGIHSEGYKVSIDQLRELHMPAITLISPGGYNHFVVVRGWEGHSIILADPQLGLRRIDESDFEAIWNGVVFVLADKVSLNQSRFNDPADLKILPHAPYGSHQTHGPDDMTSFFLNLPSLNDH